MLSMVQVLILQCEMYLPNSTDIYGIYIAVGTYISLLQQDVTTNFYAYNTYTAMGVLVMI